MHDRHLNATVASGAKGNKVVHLIGDIDDQVISPSCYVVNVESPPARAALGSAQSTGFVPLKNDGPDLLPAPAVLQPLPAFEVRMRRPDHNLLCACMAAEPPTALCLASRGEERYSARFAYQGLLERQRCIPACLAAVSDRPPLRLKESSAVGAVSSKARALHVASVAVRGAEPLISGLFDYVLRAVKALTTPGARKLIALHHGGRVAFFSAEYRCTEVSLKLQLALGA